MPNKIKMQTKIEETRLFQSFDSIVPAMFFSIQSYWDLLAQTSVLNDHLNRSVFANPSQRDSRSEWDK